MHNQPPATNQQLPAYYTLADLLAHWERGELTLSEVVAHWPRDGMANDELLRELLRALVGVLWRVMELEGEKR